jgi:ubiquinone/menaquinone biosynthesis C-methylase UbiE
MILGGPLKPELNPFFDQETVVNYENWYQKEGLRADKEEKEILQWLINRFPDVTLMIEVGCGTGHFSRWFKSLGFQVIGVDKSLNMILEAKKSNKLDYLIADAVNLPFASQSFDLVTFVTTLEFLNKPEAALQEARRIAKKGMILGVLNSTSDLGKQYKKMGGPIWDVANFYSPKELKQLVSGMSNNRIKSFYRTTLWPIINKMIPLPWGGFIGMGVKWLSKSENDEQKP